MSVHEYKIGTVPKLKAIFIILLVGTVFKVVSKGQTHSKIAELFHLFWKRKWTKMIGK